MIRNRQVVQRVLAAVALHPALRKLLVFDVGSADLESIAETMAAQLRASTGDPVRRITLFSYHNEDDLWGVGEGLPVGWQRPGLLVAPKADPTWRLLVIPDLSILSLPTARACIQLLETDLGRIERHGRSHAWVPRLAWLAACSTPDVGKLSTHLLDRFPVRLQAAGWQPARSRTDLRGSIGEVSTTDLPHQKVRETLVKTETIEKNEALLPIMEEDGIEAVADFLIEWESPGVRRHLGLARLAQALAALDGAGKALRSHVEEAAELLRIPAPNQRRPEAIPAGNPGSDPLATEHPKFPDTAPHPENSAVSESGDEIEAQTSDGLEPANALESLAQLDLETPAKIDLPPFPEDRAPVEHFAEALQLPPRGLAGKRRRGSCGSRVVASLDPQELAIVPTVFAAAPFQVIRRKNKNQADGPLLITASDWRARSRTWQPDDLLVFLFDLTALGGCDWPEALIPHFRTAYHRRSAVCLILVGSKGSRNELRAEKIQGRNILDPGVLAAFEQEPGRATPLASGLQLALETIRDAQHKGRSSILQTTLVILTDGRGNVPLAASQSGRTFGPVSSEGVDDALKIAHQLSALPRVHAILLDPQPIHGRDLVKRVADALNAYVVAVNPRGNAGEGTGREDR